MAGDGDGGIEGRWPDLPDDLLGTIYRRCSSSYDRARFAAICKSWRAAASRQPKLPAVPLLLPSTGNGWVDRKALAYSPEHSRVLRAPLPLFRNGKRIVGSYDGGWVAAAIGCRIDIVNLFTRAWVLTKGDIGCGCMSGPRTYYNFSTRKIVFSEDPASKGCILAAMSTRCIALSRLCGPDYGGWATRGYCMDASLVDIAFCNGELCGLSSRGDLLYKYAIGLNKDNAPMIISVEKITIQRPATFDPLYIFELRGKLATTMEVTRVSNSEARNFRVFELVASSDTAEQYKCMWAEVTNLGDYALFLGPGCCKAVHMSATSIHGEVERNCIYYTAQEYDDPGLSRSLDLGSCTVYCYESKGVDSRSQGIMSRGYHYPEKGHYVNDRNRCRPSSFGGFSEKLDFHENWAVVGFSPRTFSSFIHTCTA